MRSMHTVRAAGFSCGQHLRADKITVNQCFVGTVISCGACLLSSKSKNSSRAADAKDTERLRLWRRLRWGGKTKLLLPWSLLA